MSGIFFGAAGGATNSATFVTADTTTQGSWKGVYGADGYSVVNDAASYPSYASVSVNGQSSYTWAASTTDARALQKAASTTERLAACWYSATNFTIDVNLTDGNTHRLALYTIDWDGGDGRQERIEVLDAETNAVLDSREVTLYTSGKYLVWTLKGHVKLKFTHLTPVGYNAVVSGLFFDAVSSAKINWLVTDQLGTPRMVFDQTGALGNVKRHDYLPFGEELSAGMSGRTTTQGYTGDSLRQHFTGYEADGETGLNFAQARYQSPTQGRFTSVDPLGASASVADPQSFNRYSYVQNNPTNLSDPSGLEPNRGPEIGWSDVEDDFWGSSFDFNGTHFGGPAIIAAREAERDALVQARIDGKLAQSYLNKGNFKAAKRIFDNNSTVGLFQDGAALWGDFAGAFVGGYSAGNPQAAVASSDTWEAFKLGTRALVSAGWRAVADKLSELRGPDFKILQIGMVAGITRFIARGDDMSTALQGVSGGADAQVSFAVGWMIQAEKPDRDAIRNWGSGLDFSFDYFPAVGGGGIIFSPQQPKIPGVYVGVGAGGGMSGSFSYEVWR